MEEWRLLTSGNDRGFADYLARNEPRTTVMSEKYRSEPLDKRLRKGGRFYRYGESAALYHGPGGFFYPAGVAPNVPRAGQLRSLIGSFVRLYAIMGQSNDVAAIARSFAGRPSISVDYFLLSHPPCSVEPNSPPHPEISVRVPGSDEWRQLLPLHMAYEAEEVLLPGRTSTISASKATLTESLRKHVVLVAYYRGQAIARVATNARGYRTDQIGGVYTDPAWRGRGLARWLMTHLMRRLSEEGRGTSLFVKRNNVAAVKLYEALNFSFESDFRISYYR